jgi:hypothetical protein
MRVNENGQYVSDDGFWVWDGAAWVPADGSVAPAADTAAAVTSVQESAAEESAAEPVVDAVVADTPVDYASDTTASETSAFESGYGSDLGSSVFDLGSSEPGTLSSGDRVVPQVDNAHPMSPDGRHWWDGEKWIDVSTDATGGALAEEVPAEVTVDAGWQGTDREVPETSEVFTETFLEPESVSAYAAEVEAEVEAEPVVAAEAGRQLSPDGMWEWNGTQWVPADQAAAEPEPEPAKAERQLSPDGHWEWDGTAWVPAQQEAVAPVPAGAHVSPDGHWWWDGSQWLPTGR